MKRPLDSAVLRLDPFEVSAAPQARCKATGAVRAFLPVGLDPVVPLAPHRLVQRHPVGFVHGASIGPHGGLREACNLAR